MPSDAPFPAPLDELIAELQADEPDSLAATVRQALEFAGDLRDAKQGAGSGALHGAIDQIEHAVTALRRYRTRLAELAGQFASIETDLARLEAGDSLAGEDGEIETPPHG